MTTMQDVFDVYERCAALARTAAVPEAMAALTGCLSQLRASEPPDRWRALAVGARRAPLHSLLCQDPYTGDAFRKPRGYAGDAATLDYVYGFRGADGATDFGRKVFAVTTSVPVAKAVRERCEHLTSAIEARLTHGPACVVSVACGHMRELAPLSTDARGRGTFVGIDQDAESLAALSHLHDDIDVSAIPGRIRDLLKGRLAIPPADLMYASGLFDYLAAGTASALVNTLLTRLRPGGTLLIANLTPANAEVGYMEAIMDWWMQYRTRDDLLALVRHLETSRWHVDAYDTSSSRVAWLRITRLHDG